MNRTENGSVKLYSERLAKINELETKINTIESQLKQLIDEITPILNSHADAIKKLLNRYDRRSPESLNNDYTST